VLLEWLKILINFGDVVMLKNLFIVIYVIFFSVMQAYAYELDMSVDEEIQKKYNSSKLNYEVLPNLPKADNSTKSTTTQNSVPKTQPVYTTTAPNITPVDRSAALRIHRGTKFSVKSNQTIADTMRATTNVSFTTTAPVYSKYTTIPAGAKFYGVIVDSHRPQISGNGGLVVIRLGSLAYGGNTYRADGKITKANYKKVFLNNIKGRHQYWAGVDKHLKRGETFYGGSKKVANRMSNIPIVEFVSFVPRVVGALGYGVNAVVSPVTALFSKGGSLSIPAGSSFEIKLLDDVYVSR
jgi:hypothetical protein